MASGQGWGTVSTMTTIPPEHGIAIAIAIAIDGAQLIARCTTGWSDWAHGDLILTVNSLIRLRQPGGIGRMALTELTHAAPWNLPLPVLPDQDGVVGGRRTNGYIALDSAVFPPPAPRFLQRRAGPELG